MEHKNTKKETPKNVSEIAQILSDRLGVPRRKVNGTGVEDIIEAFLDEVRMAIQEGRGARLKGVGVLRLIQSKRKRAYNPKTGEVSDLERSPVRVVFKPSRKIKKNF